MQFNTNIISWTQATEDRTIIDLQSASTRNVRGHSYSSRTMPNAATMVGLARLTAEFTGMTQLIARTLSTEELYTLDLPANNSIVIYRVNRDAIAAVNQLELENKRMQLARLKLTDRTLVTTQYKEEENILQVWTTECATSTVFKVCAYAIDLHDDDELLKPATELLAQGYQSCIQAFIEAQVNMAEEAERAAREQAEKSLETDIIDILNSTTEFKQKLEKITLEIQHTMFCIEQTEKSLQKHRETYDARINEYKATLNQMNEIANENVPEKAKQVADNIKESGIVYLGDMVFLITTPLRYWDEEAAHILTRNEDDAEIKDVYTKVFIDKTHEVIFEQAVKIDANGDLYAREDKTIYGNPHHNTYNCWGDYISALNNMEKHDIYGKLLIAKTAIAGLNLYDAPVMNAFKTYIKRDRVKLKEINNETIEAE